MNDIKIGQALPVYLEDNYSRETQTSYTFNEILEYREKIKERVIFSSYYFVRATWSVLEKGRYKTFSEEKTLTYDQKELAEEWIKSVMKARGDL